MKNIIAVATLIISLSIAYYLVIFLPNKSKQEQEIKYKIELLKYQKEDETKKIYESCSTSANNDAIELLKTKAKLPGGSIYTEAASKGLYLKEDFSSLLQNCLLRNGIQK